jgi:very-short-patch-repair endonuclease
VRTSEINQAVMAICASHHGAITTALATSAGLHHHALRRRVDNGMLDQVASHIFRLAGAPDSWQQRALIAAWAHGPDALVSHRAAVLMWRLEGVTQAPMDVLVQRWNRRTSLAGVRVHEATDLIDADRTIIDSIPCTSVVRTLLDVAAVIPARRSDQVFEDALRRRLTTVEAVTNRFVQVARRGRPGTQVMRSHLSKRTGEYVPTMSEFERRVSDLAEEAGLRRPDRQIAVQLPDTTVYIDLGWREVMVGIECDGLFNHADSVRLPWDEARQNELVLRGWFILRFVWTQLRTDARTVKAQLLAAYHR